MMGENNGCPCAIPSLDRSLGCTLGGAVGDALGYPVEFYKLDEIVSCYGDSGITDLQLDSRTGKALISDDTQMTLFTLDGILTALANGGTDVHEWGTLLPKAFEGSYLKWLYTQTEFSDLPERIADYGLRNPCDYVMDAPELFSNREPGRTCLSALIALAKGENVYNHSKGCGGVMRVAPVGLLYPDNPSMAYDAGVRAANVTHKHPTSDEAGGAMASIISLIVAGKSVRQAVRQTLTILENCERSNGETAEALLHALELADSKISVRESIAALGEGWVAEEALAIAVYCAITAKSFRQGVIHAVNHDGDSDSTGAICGNILGALYGVQAIPAEWRDNLELRGFIEHLTSVFHRMVSAEVRL